MTKKISTPKIKQASAALQRQMRAIATLRNDQIDTSDPDAHQMLANPSRKAFRKEFFRPVKESLKLRIDSDVVDWFRQGGEGYQTRMNAALRQHMEQKSGRRS